MLAVCLKYVKSEIKGLKTQNLRDHMSEAELIFTALAELSTRQIAETIQARVALEKKTRKKVVSGKNHLTVEEIIAMKNEGRR